MNVSVSISLANDDPVPSMTPEEMLTALGGDPAKDTMLVNVSASHAPPPPPLPEIEPVP